MKAIWSRRAADPIHRGNYKDCDAGLISAADHVFTKSESMQACFEVLRGFPALILIDCCSAQAIFSDYLLSGEADTFLKLGFLQTT